MLLIILQKYEIVFTVCEHIILTVFTWEILVKWFYGFAIFWRVLCMFVFKSLQLLTHWMHEVQMRRTLENASFL